jgi:cytoskeletal protein CcmA (bactofilin family)
MALFGKKKQPQPQRRATDEIEAFGTVLGKTCEFTGELSSQESVRIDGHAVGTAEIADMVRLGPECNWQGSVSADVVVVEGRVEGDIAARSKLDLLAGARVTGDIRSPVIAMDVGAICEGQIHMAGQGQPRRYTGRRAED